MCIGRQGRVIGREQDRAHQDNEMASSAINAPATP
jgi:hypothetical protein